NDNGTDQYTFENFTHSDLIGEQLPLYHVYSILEDSKGRIWLALNGGGVALLHEKGNKKKFQIFSHDPENSRSLSNDEVFVIFEDSKQRLWFGTSQGGLNVLREKEDDITVHQYYFDRYMET